MLNSIMAIMRQGESSLQLAASAHAPALPNEPAWRDLHGNKRLCLLVTQRSPTAQPLLAPSAQSVTDQEQSAGPVLVA